MFAEIEGQANISQKEFGVVAFTLFAVTIIALLCFRDARLISDGESYIAHAQLDIDFSDPTYYVYPIYWLVVSVVGPLNPDYFPGFLSFLSTLLLVVAASLALKAGDKFIFIIICLVNPIPFTVFQLALRNGVAVGFFLLAIATKRKSYSLIAALIHPGVLPVMLIFYALNHFRFSRGSLSALAILVMLGVLLFEPVSNAVLISRGYEVEQNAGQEGVLTYAIYGILAVAYWGAMPGSRLRWFFPLMLGIWIIVGAEYSFAWRLFAQAIPVSLFLILSCSNPRGVAKTVFVLGLSLLSVYAAVKSHPFVDYSSGWFGNWVGFF